MAIKLDTSSPQQQMQQSFDPLPGVTDVDTGAARAYKSVSQSIKSASNTLYQTKQANQKLLINEARYTAMGQMENDYRVIDDVIRNNKGGADELLKEFNNKYKEIDLNSYLPEDETDKITDPKLSQNILGELNYRYGGYANQLETLGTNVSFTNRKVNHVKETSSKFNEFYSNNPIISNSNELEFQALITEMYDPEADNIEPYFSGSTTTTQRTAFTNPQGQSLKSNMSNYLADSPTIAILAEREQYAREIFNEYGTAYGLDVSDIDTSTLRKNIIKQEEENAQARIDELLNPLEGSFTAIGKNPGYEDFYNNVGRILEVTKDIHPSLMKYATDKQLAKINKINSYMMLLTPPTDEEGNVVGIAPMQEILMHSTLSDDTNYALNQLAQFNFTEEELKEVNGFVNTVRANITEAEKNNRTDYYRYIFPQYANFIDQKHWADAQSFYEQNILRKEIVDEETEDVVFYGHLKKLPKYVGDFRPLFDMPEKGIYDEETLTNNILQLQLANEGNTNFASAAQYLINGEGGHTLSAQQAIVAELVAGTQNDSEAITILGPKLVSIEGNYPEATIAQVEEIRKAMSDNAEDDYDFRFFKDKTNVIQDLHYAVEATENAKNTSKYNFYNTMLNNLIAQGITDNKSVDQIQLDVSAFVDEYVTPTFGRYAVFEHDDRNLEIQLHPEALDLVDSEMPRGNYYRGFNEVGKNVFQKEFSTRAADDVSESVFNAVFAFSYAFHELETKGMYEAMGTDPLGESAFPEQVKSRDGFAAFVDGSVKNTFVPDQFKTFLGGPIEGYEGRNVAKVVRRGDFYIPMYYDKSALKYTEFTDRNGVTVMAPVDRVHASVRSYNIEKNKMSQIQVIDVMGPWKKKTNFFMDYFGPGIKPFVPNITTGL